MNVPLFPFRMAATVLGSFGVLAIVLAAIGIYGVMSYVVAGRTREIGVRIALGAARRDVLALIIKQGMTLAVLGLGIGLLAAFGVAQLLARLLFGVSPVDLPTFAVVSLMLILVAGYFLTRTPADNFVASEIVSSHVRSLMIAPGVP